MTDPTPEKTPTEILEERFRFSAHSQLHQLLDRDMHDLLPRVLNGAGYAVIISLVDDPRAAGLQRLDN